MKTIDCIWTTRAIIASFAVLAGAGSNLQAQRPQDNWYLEYSLNKSTGNGALSGAYGVAIGNDGRVFVADDGADRVVIYDSAGTYLSAVVGPFGEGFSFSSPRGMTCDREGNLYVSDAGQNAVFIFDPDGVFVRKIGNGTGSGNGQLSGVVDVAVANNGEVLVLERTNARVSVFGSSGEFLRLWGAGSGNVDGYLQWPMSISVAPDNRVYIVQSPDWISTLFYPAIFQNNPPICLKIFDLDGRFINKWSTVRTLNNAAGSTYANAVVGVRTDSSNRVHMISAISVWPNPQNPNNTLIEHLVADSDGNQFYSTAFSNSGNVSDRYNMGNYLYYPGFGIGRDGSMVIALRNAKMLLVFRNSFREQYVPPRNTIPLPAVTSTIQRPNSPFIDIDYEVTDADDATVQTAMLVFRNGTQTLASCIRDLTLVEGTESKLGPGITTNQKHRVTWNSGADWATSLGDYRVAILAKDSRQGLLDIHYLDLPADRGTGPLRISRSPLIETDYMQVWWWLLATHDTGIRLDPAGKIYGVGGSYDNVLLCDGSATPATKAEGRTYLFGKLGVREATTDEVTWAKEGAGTSPPLQNSPARSVGGRPIKTNEYGFDTGDWSAASLNARWVVALP